MNAPVPCMSGDAGRCTRSAPASTMRLRERPDLGHRVGRRRADERVRAVAEHAEQVLGAPHDALRHAGGAARVEEVEVVAAALDARHRLVRGEQLLVLDRELLARRAVVDLDPELHVRRAVADLGDVVAERAVEQQRLGVGVVEQVRRARPRGSGSSR